MLSEGFCQKVYVLIKNECNPAPVYFDNSPIPWLKKNDHLSLGHILYKDGYTNHDTDLKKKFIKKIHSLCQLLKNRSQNLCDIN